jgi:transcriptional regulator with AAA-type ATPase domain/tetratricopeptide (TPR) repeat protein
LIKRMELIADRFARADDNTIVDIATGRAVSWRPLGALCDPADDRRWRESCGTLCGLWHEELPPLIDYGPMPDGSRFEAFERPPMFRGTGAGAIEFLRAAGLAEAPGIEPGARLRRPGKGFSVGIRLVRRSALDRVSELLEEARSGRPLLVGYTVEAGGGLATFLRAASREAISRGFVPVSVGALRRWPALEGRVGDRHLLLLATPDDGCCGEPERVLLRFALVSARGHLLLRPARRERQEIRLVLGPVAAEALARAVHVHPAGALSDRVIARAAERSCGQPGRFIALLAGRAGEAGGVLRVAEARPEYRIASVGAPSPDVARWIERGEEATRVAAAGRYAHGRRALAEASAALRRRHEPVRAARCELALGNLLLAHGSADQAESVLRRAHADLDEVDEHDAVRCAAGIGAALIQKGQLEPAEAVLRAARERGRYARPCVLLARCLGWQSRYEEAERALGPAIECSERPVRAEALVVLARFALANESLPDAGRAASLALAETEGEAAVECVRAAAHEVLAAVQGRIADLPAAEGHFAAALAAARRGHAPVRTISVRLAQLESARRGDAPTDGRSIVRLERLARSGIPPLLRARIDAVLREAHPCADSRRAHAARCDAFIRASGAAALRPTLMAPAATAVAQDAAALMALLAGESDPRRLLEGVAERLRGRLEATTVAIMDAQNRLILCSGRTVTFSSTRRALASRQPIPPHLSEHGIEAAVPIEYAGEAVGVLGARWTIDRQPPSAAMPLMMTGASCGGPAVQALCDRAGIEVREAPANGIVGRSRAIACLQDSIRRVGPCPFPVLIEGESGAGKELVAKGLHASSARRLRAFQAVNCAAFQDDLFEAELFGHARGAFTGAHAERAGLFEQADSGTLFLDEVSELTPRAQAKLLRVLQEGEVRRVGENAPRRVDVRIIAASNRPLEEEVKAGRFRQDLLFRLAVIRLSVPPLRDRREDIPLLVSHLWRDAAPRAGSRATISSGAISLLARWDWPGNVRELQNVIAALAVRVPRGRVEAADVEALVSQSPAPPAAVLEEARRAFERAHVSAALARCGGCQARAARELGITRQGLAKLMARLGIGKG